MPRRLPPVRAARPPRWAAADRRRQPHRGEPQPGAAAAAADGGQPGVRPGRGRHRPRRPTRADDPDPEPDDAAPTASAARVVDPRGAWPVAPPTHRARLRRPADRLDRRWRRGVRRLPPAAARRDHAHPAGRGRRPGGVHRPRRPERHERRTRRRASSRGHHHDPRRGPGRVPGDRQAGRADRGDGRGPLDELRPDVGLHHPVGHHRPDGRRHRVLDRRAGVPAGRRPLRRRHDAQPQVPDERGRRHGGRRRVRAATSPPGRSASCRRATTATSCG